VNAKKPLLSHLRILSFVFVLALLFVYVFEQKDEISILRHIGPSDIFWILWAVFLYNFVNAMRFLMIYRMVGASLGIWENFGLSVVATTTNLLLPGQAGGIARGIYLNRVHQVPFSKVPALMLGAIVLTVSLAGMVLLIINLAALFQGLFVPPIIWMISILGCLAIGSLWITGPARLSIKSRRIQNMIQLFFEAWAGFLENPRTLMLICLYQLLSFLCSGTILWLAFRGLEIQIDLMTATVLMIATSLLSTVNILPGNMGLQEATIAYLSTLAGISFIHGFLVATVIRITTTLFVLALLPVSWFLLFKKKGISIVPSAQEKS